MKNSQYPIIFLVCIILIEFTSCTVIPYVNTSYGRISIPSETDFKPLSFDRISTETTIGVYEDRKGYIWTVHAGGIRKYAGSALKRSFKCDGIRNLKEGTEILIKERDNGEIWFIPSIPYAGYVGNIYIYNPILNDLEHYDPGLSIERIIDIDKNLILLISIKEYSYSISTINLSRRTHLEVYQASGIFDDVFYENGENIWITNNEHEIHGYSILEIQNSTVTNQISIDWCEGYIYSIIETQQDSLMLYSLKDYGEYLLAAAVLYSTETGKSKEKASAKLDAFFWPERGDLLFSNLSNQEEYLVQLVRDSINLLDLINLEKEIEEHPERINSIDSLSKLKIEKKFLKILTGHLKQDKFNSQFEIHLPFKDEIEGFLQNFIPISQSDHFFNKKRLRFKYKFDSFDYHPKETTKYAENFFGIQIKELKANLRKKNIWGGYSHIINDKQETLIYLVNRNLTCKVWTVGDKEINAIYESSFGNLYLATIDGVYYLSSEDCKNAINSYFEKDLLSILESTKEQQDTIWSITEKGFCLIDNHNSDTLIVLSHSPDNGITSFFFDQKNIVWIKRKLDIVAYSLKTGVLQIFNNETLKNAGIKHIEYNGEHYIYINPHYKHSKDAYIYGVRISENGHIDLTMIKTLYDSSLDVLIYGTNGELVLKTDKDKYYSFDHSFSSVAPKELLGRGYISKEFLIDNHLYIYSDNTLTRFNFCDSSDVVVIYEECNSVLAGPDQILWVTTKSDLLLKYDLLRNEYDTCYAIDESYLIDINGNYVTGKNSQGYWLLKHDPECTLIFQDKKLTNSTTIQNKDGVFYIENHRVFFQSFDRGPAYEVMSDINYRFDRFIGETNDNPVVSRVDEKGSCELFLIRKRTIPFLESTHYYLQNTNIGFDCEDIPHWSYYRSNYYKKYGNRPYRNYRDQEVNEQEYNTLITHLTTDAVSAKSITINFTNGVESNFAGIFKLRGGIDYRYGQQIDVEFECVQQPDNVLYTFQLVSAVDTSDWSPLSTSNWTRLENLDAGDYELWVNAVDTRGNYTQEPAILSFRVHPWWHNLEVIRLVGVFTIGLLILLFITRERTKRNQAVRRAELVRARMQEREKTKQRIARDLHDESGQDTVKMQRQLELLEAYISVKSDDLKELLNSVQSNLRTIRDTIRIFSWSVEKGTPTLEDLANDLYKIGHEGFEYAAADFTFDADFPDDREYTFDPEERQNIVMLFREAITNCLKHSRCSLAELSIYIHQVETLTIEFEDNGVGFTSESEAVGSGLKNMQKRAEQINANLEVTSTRGEGTKIVFSKPASREKY